jgi:hypothetical protein
VVVCCSLCSSLFWCTLLDWLSSRIILVVLIVCRANDTSPSHFRPPFRNSGEWSRLHHICYLLCSSLFWRTFLSHQLLSLATPFCFMGQFNIIGCRMPTESIWVSGGSCGPGDGMCQQWRASMSVSGGDCYLSGIKVLFDSIVRIVPHGCKGFYYNVINCEFEWPGAVHALVVDDMGVQCVNIQGPYWMAWNFWDQSVHMMVQSTNLNWHLFLPMEHQAGRFVVWHILMGW